VLVGKGHMSGFNPLEIFLYPNMRFMKGVKNCIPNDVDSHKSFRHICKVKESHKRSGVAQRVPVGLGFQIP
jgi:hypothetical protein